MKIKILIDNKTKNEWNAEWGLAVWVEYEGHRILLDAGTSGIFTENADSMGVDLAQVEFGVLSHAHYDHSDGLESFFERNKDAVFYLRNTCAENCYSKKDGTELTYIGIKPGYLEALKIICKMFFLLKACVIIHFNVCILYIKVYFLLN